MLLMMSEAIAGNTKRSQGPINYSTQLHLVGYNRPDHDQQHCYHHAPTVEPEAATATIELLMMGVRTPETC
jgi:hypothetical protein